MSKLTLSLFVLCISMMPSQIEHKTKTHNIPPKGASSTQSIIIVNGSTLIILLNNHLLLCACDNQALVKPSSCQTTSSLRFFCMFLCI